MATRFFRLDPLRELVPPEDSGEVELVDADDLERELWAEQRADEAAEAQR